MTISLQSTQLNYVFMGDNIHMDIVTYRLNRPRLWLVELKPGDLWGLLKRFKVIMKKLIAFQLVSLVDSQDIHVSKKA